MTEPSQYFKGRTVQEQMNEVIGYVDTRAAEVATTAIASDVAQVHQDMLDADADAQAAAASAAAAAGTLANAVKKTGEASQSIAGDIAVAGDLSARDVSVGRNLGVGGTVSLVDMVVSGIATVPTPTGNNHAANKKYVDDKDALDVHLAGNETITGNKTVPLEATGTFSNQIASSNKVKNELDNYTPMVRTSGNQTISGSKRFNSQVNIVGLAGAPATRSFRNIISINDTGTSYLGGTITVQYNENGTTLMYIQVRNSDGTAKNIVLGSGDVI